MSERHWFESNGPVFEGSIGPQRRGRKIRRARFSYLAKDAQGRTVRLWHREPSAAAGYVGLGALKKAEIRSLKGMTKP